MDTTRKDTKRIINGTQQEEEESTSMHKMDENEGTNGGSTQTKITMHARISLTGNSVEITREYGTKKSDHCQNINTRRKRDAIGLASFHHPISTKASVTMAGNRTCTAMPK